MTIALLIAAGVCVAWSLLIVLALCNAAHHADQLLGYARGDLDHARREDLEVAQLEAIPTLPER